MVWIIKCWIVIEEENPITYTTKEELEIELASLELMQPGNKYIVVGNKIKCYIPVEPEDPVRYPTKGAAQKDIDGHFSILQPENIYEAVQVSE